MNVSFSAAIGNFDGVHKGHKKLLEKLKNDADKSGLKTKVLTFNPYPFEFFKWHKKRIINEFDKKEILKEIGIDEIVSIKFDEKFRNLKAEEFFELYIKKGKIKSLTVGNDFKFGKDREGNVDILNSFSKIYNYEINLVNAVNIKNKTQIVAIRLLFKDFKMLT